MKNLKNTDRRNFLLAPLKYSFASAFFPFLAQGRESNKKLKEKIIFKANDYSPLIDITALPSFSSPVFSGESIDRPHEVLWDLDNYITKKGGIPLPHGHYDVVIVGAGISGLTAAFYLKDKKVLILEEQNRLGGNSQGEKWNESAYSEGAAYISPPEEGSSTDQFFKEIGLLTTEGREELATEMKVLFQGKFRAGLFEGDLDPANKKLMEEVVQKLNKMYEEDYPEMPYVEGELNRDKFNQLDNISLYHWFKNNIPERPILFDEFITQYCWSSFNADWDEISAAQGLNFILSDMQSTLAFPGGNAFIAQNIYKSLMSSLTPPQIKNKSFVCRIKKEQEKTFVTYENADRKLETVTCSFCIMATPKKFNKHIIPQISADQLYAMDRISYRSYLVANVLLKENKLSEGYDLFALKGQIPDGARRDLESRYATDVIFANWASKDQGPKTILTFYIPRSYQGAEQYLLSPNAHEKYKDKLLTVLPDFLKAMGLNLDHVEGIRLTRWGHALPIAKTGLIASGILEKAHAPIDDKIFFAHQDNWANPCFETSFQSARTVSLRIKEIMSK